MLTFCLFLGMAEGPSADSVCSTPLSYTPAMYRSRTILVTRGSEQEWALWLYDLGPEEILWFIQWYRIPEFIKTSVQHHHVYLLGFTHSTWYSATRVLRQMRVDQGVPLPISAPI